METIGRLDGFIVGGPHLGTLVAESYTLEFNIRVTHLLKFSYRRRSAHTVFLEVPRSS